MVGTSALRPARLPTLPATLTMASSMVIPASKDTLFMRGFSSRQDIDGLR